MKKVLLIVFIVLFIVTAIVTILGMIGAVPFVKEEYLDKLVYTLIVEAGLAIVTLFRKTDFFNDEKDVTKKSEIDRIVSAHGFIYEKFVLTDELFLNGESTTTFECRLKCKNQIIKKRDHGHYTFGENEINKPRVEFEGFSQNSTLSCLINRKGTKSLGLQVNFSPALSFNESAEYKLKVYKDKGTYSMTYEDVVEQIKKDDYCSSEPIEFHGFNVKYPVDKLQLIMVFPIQYEISGDEFFDVFPSDSFERLNEEFSRLKKEKSFEIIKKNETKCLSLTVRKPIIGLSYVIKWRPPKNEAYRKLIK